MDSRDSAITIERKPSVWLRRSVASSNTNTKPEMPAENSHDMLDMDAFHDRQLVESSRAAELKHSLSGITSHDGQQLNATTGDARRRRQRRVSWVKRLKRKHGFKILTVSLLLVFFWLLWNS